MKILILYRHFWPDSPPYASMLRSIGGHLAAQGLDVTVWCQEPGYKATDRLIDAPRRDVVDGIKVERQAALPGFRRAGLVRTLDKVLFPLRLLAKAMWRRLRGENFDLVWTATIPPVVQGMIGRWIARLFGAKFLYHCQDLYPELGAHSGSWKAGGVVDRAMRAVEAHNRREADVLVALSADMADTVRALAQPRGELATINNLSVVSFTGESDALPLPAKTGPRGDGPVELMFAGNVGRFQNLHLVLDGFCASRAAPDRMQLTFLGDGAAKEGLQKRAADLANVAFLPHRRFAEARAIITRADVGIVSLEPGIFRLAFPSKTITYLSLGLPVLCIVEPESEIASLIRDNGLGWTAAPDVAAIAEATASIEGARADLPDIAQRVRSYYTQNMANDAILGQWSALASRIGGQTHAGNHD